MKEIEFHTFNCGSFHVSQRELQAAMTHIQPSAGSTEVKGGVAAPPSYHSVTAALYLKPAFRGAAGGGTSATEADVRQLRVNKDQLSARDPDLHDD